MASGTSGFVQLRLELMEGLVQPVQVLSDGQLICASFFAYSAATYSLQTSLIFSVFPQVAMFFLSCIPLLLMFSLLRMCYSLIQ